MSQVTLVGRIVAAQNPFDNGTFKKQTLIIEVVSGSYTSYYPVDFTQNEVQTLLPQVQMGQTYQFTGYLQGSKNQQQDKNGQPTAYLSFNVKQVAPAQSQVPAANSGINQQANGFGQPQQQAQQPQGGFIGGQPQQGFGTPAPNQGFAQPSQPQGFGNAPQQGFGQPQQNAAPGFGTAVQPNTGFGQ